MLDGDSRGDAMNIKPGDLVMVVRGRECCGAVGTAIGRVFRVRKIYRGPVNPCNECGSNADRTLAMEEELLGYAVSRLKRLDPDALKDDIHTTDEVTA